MTESWAVGTILPVTEKYFARHGIESARLDAELLLANTLDMPREALLARRERALSDIEVSTYRERVRQRGLHQPVAYMLGQKEFYSVPFVVDPRVLIPRPETELLVDLAIRHAGMAGDGRAISICDVGTGSGCVAGAIAASIPGAFVTATDFSLGATNIAVANLSALGLLRRARVVLCDLFPADVAEPYDVIVSNPPYLSIEEFNALPPGIRKFEPRMALTDESNGATIYRRILKMARTRLSRGGVIFFEISPRIGGMLSDGTLIGDLPFVRSAIHNDLAGLPRAAEIRFAPN